MFKLDKRRKTYKKFEEAISQKIKGKKLGHYYNLYDRKDQSLKKIERPRGLKHHYIYSTNLQFKFIEQTFKTNIKINIERILDLFVINDEKSKNEINKI